MRPVFLCRSTGIARGAVIIPLFVIVTLFQLLFCALIRAKASTAVRMAIVLAILAPLAAFADADGARLRLAEAALAAGDYVIAERELLPLTQASRANPQAVKLLTETYWRTGQDKKLLDLTERHYAGKEKDVWWCRVLERRGHANDAADCWFSIDEHDRGRRALRAKVFTQELAPGRAVGVRRD